MRLGKSIHGERRDALHDVVLGLGADAVAGHAGAQAAFEILHALHGAAHAHGAAQLFGFSAGEAGDGHGHAQQLLLKERHAERALEHRLKRGMRIGDFFFALAAAHVGVHHFADDGAGANDGHLHDQIVKASGRVVRNGGHLRAALHLEHAHGVGLAQRLVDQRIFRQRGQVDFFFVVARNQLDAFLEHGHHAQAEQIDLDDAEVGAVFLVPLHHGAAGHGGALDGDDAIQHAGADDHAAGVLAEMARQVLHAHAEVEIARNARMADVEAGLLEVARHGVVVRRATPSGPPGWRGARLSPLQSRAPCPPRARRSGRDR